MTVRIRRWSLSDAKALSKILNNPRILAFLRDGIPFPYTERDAADYISAMLSADENDTFAYAVTADSVLVRSISAFRGSNIHFRTAEVGYYLDEDFWGKGIMTCALNLLCEKLFSDTDLLRLYAEPFSYNTASRRVLEKAGFVQEGVMKCGAVKNGSVLDISLYARTR